jgi:large subunit ribosomal protein L10
MPGKEELFSKLLFLINAPAQRLVTVVNAIGRDLAIVIDQGVKENKFAAGAEVKSEAPKAAAPAAPVEIEAPAAGTSTDPVEGATAEESAAPVETAEVAPEKQAEAAAEEDPAEGA